MSIKLDIITYQFGWYMKNFKFITLFFPLFMFVIHAQELDESYLNSLPDDIKKDLMARADLNQNQNEEIDRLFTQAS